MPDDKGQLRFITCGSVDDGKSTLLGRLLHDSGQLKTDQVAALEKTAGKKGCPGELDWSLALDGLLAEREQGITIDVAHRYFETPKRKFIALDAPGHQQYTRNMATAASGAEAAVVLVDAQNGVSRQTLRHTYIAALLGIRHMALAVNKMDLVHWNKHVFDGIKQEFLSFARAVGGLEVTPMPISAKLGDNVFARSRNMPWHDGPTLAHFLEEAPSRRSGGEAPWRFPVQFVNRPSPEFRGYCGESAGGGVRPGDEVLVLPSGLKSRVRRIVTMDGDLDEAGDGQAATITLEDELDVSRGDVLAHPDSPPEVTQLLRATVIWFDDEPLLPGRSFWLRIGPAKVQATVLRILEKTNLNGLTGEPAHELAANDVGEAELSLLRLLAFDPYEQNPRTGGFILVDRLSGATAGAGLIRFSLRRDKALFPQNFAVTPQIRAAQKNQQPMVVWFTGFSASGKSTIANLVDKSLVAMGRHTCVLDGDNIRLGLNRDLGFTPADRVENIRRVAETAKLMVDAGLIVLTAFISPYRSDRDMARSLFPPGRFVEVFVDTPLDICERRDFKGLYARARSESIPNFTGVSAPYERPESAELVLDGAAMSPEELAALVVAHIGKIK